MDENLEALVSLAQAGDKQAFGQIYDQLIDEIYRFIYFKVHDQMLAQDITSECFKKLLINLRGYKRKNFKAYVYTVARNVFIDYTRDQKHYKSGIVMAELVDPQAQSKV